MPSEILVKKIYIFPSVKSALLRLFNIFTYCWLDPLSGSGLSLVVSWSLLQKFKALTGFFSDPPPKPLFLKLCVYVCNITYHITVIPQSLQLSFWQYILTDRDLFWSSLMTRFLAVVLHLNFFVSYPSGYLSVPPREDDFLRYEYGIFGGAYFRNFTVFSRKF